MGQVSRISESEIKRISKLIIESMYDELDYADAFFSLFKKWCANKFGEEIFNKSPFSALLDRYGQKFTKEIFGDKYSNYFGDKNVVKDFREIVKIGKYLVQSNIHALPSERPQTKFSVRHKRRLDFLYNKLKFPDFCHVEYVEDESYKLLINIHIDDYDKFLKTEHFPNLWDVRKEYEEFITKYLGVDIGNPLHGMLTFGVNYIYDDFDNGNWEKTVWKKMKKEIKQLPGCDQISSFSMTQGTNGFIEVKARTKGIFWNYSELRKEVLKYLTDKGYKKINIQFV